jgi:hypothetical protein
VLAEGISIVFLATPPDVSMELAPALLAAGVKVVDLSGAFRLRTPAAYSAWYKEPHTQPDLLAEAADGLPEFCREPIPAARLVAEHRVPTPAMTAYRFAESRREIFNFGQERSARSRMQPVLSSFPSCGAKAASPLTWAVAATYCS